VEQDGARWSKVEQGGARWSRVEQGGAMRRKLCSNIALH